MTLIAGPIIWIMCGFWFYNSARRVNARPWPWVGVMLAASVGFGVLLYIPYAFYAGARITPSSFSGQEQYQATQIHDFIDKLFTMSLIIADVGVVIALRSIMMKRAPFKTSTGTACPGTRTHETRSVFDPFKQLHPKNSTLAAICLLAVVVAGAAAFRISGIFFWATSINRTVEYVLDRLSINAPGFVSFFKTMDPRKTGGSER